MRKNESFRLTVTLLFVAAACVFTILLMKVDVKCIGPLHTSIGFSKINSTVRDFFGCSNIWYDITKYIGFLAIGIAGIIVLIGLYQLIRRRSLLKVDVEILVMAIVYVLLAALYILFEKFVVNYRPVIMEGKDFVEASYPSSHTMLTCTIMITGAIAARKHLANRDVLRGVVTVGAGMISFIMIVGRLLSGVHWLTDIIGAVLFSGALISLYCLLLAFIHNKKLEKQCFAE